MKAHKTSPDAWMQMTKQLAYGKMHNGEPAVTYESAQTRKFKLGRTEVIRAASNESKAFVQAMLKEGVSVSLSYCARRVLSLT
jgi:carnitine O-acetyltransferase